MSTIPDFWRSRVEDVNRFVHEGVSRGGAERIAESAGGLPIWSVAYGMPARPQGTANFSAASGARDLSPYLGEPEGSDTPVLLLVCATHGGEMEGVVGALNLLQIFETGADMRGRRWPELQAVPESARVVVVPLHNPDGRARVRPESLVGAEYDQFRYWCQGAWKNGDLIGYPACKKHQPLPPDSVSFLGGYPNGDGYNIVHDVDPSGPKSPEGQAFMQLVERERPDLVVHVHSSEQGPFFIVPDRLTPEGHQNVQLRLQDDARARWEAHDLRPLQVNTRRVRTSRKPLYNLQTATYAASGALSTTFEGPHGLKVNPYTHDEILDAHLVMYRSVTEALLTYPIRLRDLNN